MNKPARPDTAQTVLVLGGLALITVIYGGAWTAAAINGGTLNIGHHRTRRVISELLLHPHAPSAAWGRDADLPGPLLYWTCTAAVAVLVAALAALGTLAWYRATSHQRERLGVPLNARLARRRDLQPLVIKTLPPPPGRVFLGRLAPRGPLLATEAPTAAGRTRSHGGGRGSIALIGPTRSGKTTLATTAITTWDGPVIALSVKRDLYDLTIAARRQRGDVAVFDPAATTGIPTARWSPLRDVTNDTAVRRAARALSDSLPRHHGPGADFWTQQAEALIAGYFAIAGLTRILPTPTSRKSINRLSMAELSEWCHRQYGLTHGHIQQVLATAEAHKGDDARLCQLAHLATTNLGAITAEDPRLRSSIYATARLVLAPWSEPSVADSAQLDQPEHGAGHGRYIGSVDLPWLLHGEPRAANTLYLSAPDTEFERLAPVLGGLLGDLRCQIHHEDLAGRPLPKPLLIVIDEAGQLDLRWLPGEVSTLAGLGAILLTCWQSRAQMQHRYGTLADAVLAGHRTKIIFNGTDDPSTLDYITRLTGTTERQRQTWSRRGTGAAGRSDTTITEPLISPHHIRQMRRHEAMLLHGNRPPARLRIGGVETTAKGQATSQKIERQVQVVYRTASADLVAPRSLEAPIPTIDDGRTHDEEEVGVPKRPPVHTVPDGSGWANRREGATRISKRFDTKAEAQAAGQETAMREKTEHLIHKRDGEIGQRNSYGNDPNPPKG